MADKEIDELTSASALDGSEEMHILQGPNSRRASFSSQIKTYLDTIYAAATHSHTVSQLSDATANGRSWLQAANYTAMKALLSLAKGDVGLGNVDNTSDATKFTNPSITGTIVEDVFTITDAAGYVINPNDGSVQRWTLTASRTPGAPSANWANGKSVTLFISDGSAYTINWATMGVVWKGGTAPTLATSGYTEVNITQENGVLRGVHIGDFAS